MSYIRSNEYTAPTVSGGGCQYTTLGTYNQGYYGRGFMAPVPSTTGSFEVITVPSVQAPGYNALTHNGERGCCSKLSSSDVEYNSDCSIGRCTGYFDIRKAYPSYPNSCNTYTSRLCS